MNTSAIINALYTSDDRALKTYAAVNYLWISYTTVDISTRTQNLPASAKDVILINSHYNLTLHNLP